MNNYNVLGVDVTPLASYAEAVATVEQWVAARRKGWIAAVNPEKIYHAQSDETLRALLNAADLKLCDGVGTALAVRSLYGRWLPRVTGIQLFHELIAAAARNGWRVFLLGASEESNAGAAANLLAKHPNLQLVGRHNGYFEDEAAVIQTINAAQPDVLFVAMGSPRQEFWITQHRDTLDATVCMGVGGSLDVVSGKARWAPHVFRKTGTEWLYRLVTDPRRWRRRRVLREKPVSSRPFQSWNSCWMP